MRCAVFAYHDVGCAGIEALHALNQQIVAVFTHEDDPNENTWFGSVRERAEELGIPVFTPENVNDGEWIKKIKSLKPDILFSFYYRKMIPDCILHIAPKGGLNLHGSLLPKYRGRAPVNWVLVNGESETGLTLHYMVKKPDAGDIIAQRKVAIADEDTALTLYRKLIPLVRDILQEAVPLLESGQAPRIPQDHSQATYFTGRKPEDGRIDWRKPAREIYNLVRAVTHPYPGAFTSFEQRKLFVWSARTDDSDGAPGTVLELDPLTIACGRGSLRIQRIQTEGKPEQDAAEWAAQNRLKIGTILGT